MGRRHQRCHPRAVARLLRGLPHHGTLASARYFSFAALDRLSLASAGYGSSLAFAPGGALGLYLPRSDQPLSVHLLAFHESPWAASGTPALGDSKTLRAALGLEGILLPGRLGISTTLDVGRARRDEMEDPAGQTPSIPMSEDANLHVAGRLDLRLSTHQSLSLVYAAHTGSVNNPRSPIAQDRDAQINRDERFGLLGLLWRYENAAGLRLTARTSAQRTQEKSSPSLCAEAPNKCETINSLIQLAPASLVAPMDVTSLAINVAAAFTCHA